MSLFGFFDEDGGLLGGLSVAKGPKPKRLRAGFRAVERKLAPTPVKGVRQVVSAKQAFTQAPTKGTLTSVSAAQAFAPPPKPTVAAVRPQQLLAPPKPAVVAVAANTGAGLFSPPTVTVAAVKPPPAPAPTPIVAPALAPAPRMTTSLRTSRYVLSGLSMQDLVDVTGQLPAESGAAPTTEPDPAAPDQFGVPLDHRPQSSAWISEDLWASWPDSAVPHTNGVRWQHRLAFPVVDNTELLAQLRDNSEAGSYLPGWVPIWLMAGNTYPGYGAPNGNQYMVFPPEFFSGEKRAFGKERTSPLDGRDLDWSQGPPRPDSMSVSAFIPLNWGEPGNAPLVMASGTIPGYYLQPGYHAAGFGQWAKWPADVWRLDLADAIPDVFSPFGVPIDLLSHYVAGDIPDGQGPEWRQALQAWLIDNGILPGTPRTVAIDWGRDVPVIAAYPQGIGSLTVYNPDGSDYANVLRARGIGPQVPPTPVQPVQPTTDPNQAGLPPDQVPIYPPPPQEGGQGLPVDSGMPPSEGMLPSGGDYYVPDDGTTVSPTGEIVPPYEEPEYFEQPDAYYGTEDYQHYGSEPTGGFPPIEPQQIYYAPYGQSVADPGFSVDEYGYGPMFQPEFDPAFYEPYGDDVVDFQPSGSIDELAQEAAGDAWSQEWVDENEYAMVPEGFSMMSPEFGSPIPGDNSDGWGEGGI